MLNFDLKHYSGARLTLLSLTQLKSIDGFVIHRKAGIHRKADKTVFPEMSVIFEVLLYPELQVNPDHM